MSIDGGPSLDKQARKTGGVKREVKPWLMMKQQLQVTLKVRIIRHENWIKWAQKSDEQQVVWRKNLMEERT